MSQREKDDKEEENRSGGEEQDDPMKQATKDDRGAEVSSSLYTMLI